MNLVFTAFDVGNLRKMSNVQRDKRLVATHGLDVDVERRKGPFGIVYGFFGFFDSTLATFDVVLTLPTRCFFGQSPIV